MDAPPALFTKWHWRFANPSADVWKLVNSNKYGSTEGDWSTKQITRACGTRLWPHICKVKDQFLQQVRHEIASGERSKFLSHLWLGQTILSQKYPRIFKICQMQQGSIKKFGALNEGQLASNLRLRRIPYDHEIDEVTELLNDLSNVMLTVGDDRLLWIHDKGGTFSVSNCYNKVYRVRGPPLQLTGLPIKFIWNGQIPARVNMFL